MPGIAGDIINGVVNVTTAIVSGVAQKRALERGQEESRKLHEAEMAESKATRLSNERLARANLSLERKALKQSGKLAKEELALKRSELGMVQEQNARTAFRNQVSNLTGLYKQSEELRDLMIHRIKGLRG